MARDTPLDRVRPDAHVIDLVALERAGTLEAPADGSATPQVVVVVVPSAAASGSSFAAEVHHLLEREPYPARTIVADLATALAAAPLRDEQVLVVLDPTSGSPQAVLPPLLVAVRDGEADLAVVRRRRRGPAHRAAAALLRLLVRLVLPGTRGSGDPFARSFAARAAMLPCDPAALAGRQDVLGLLARAPWDVLVEVPAPVGGPPPRRPRERSPQPESVLGTVRTLLLLRRPAPHPTAITPSYAPASHALEVIAAPDGALARVARTAATLVPAAGAAGRLRAVRSWRPSTWVIVGLLVAFSLGEVVWAATSGNGPFLDEGIYITGGVRTLEGHGVSDGYPGWFAGSLLWPALAGAGFKVGGLLGARALAALLLTAALACSARAARNLFGGGAAVWATVALMASGPTLALGHLAVYDVVAALGLSACLACLSELHRVDHRRWVVLAALSFVLAVLGKYPAAFLLPVLVLALVQLRRRTWRTDLTLFGLTVAGALLAYALPLRPQLAFFLRWRLINNPSFGATAGTVGLEAGLYGGGFVLLAVLGVLTLRRGRPLGATLALAVVVFPAYHLLTVNSVSANKHLVLGALVAAPVLGGGLSRLAARGRAGLAAALLLAVGLSGLAGVQARWLDQTWSDQRPVAAYLAEHVRPGQRLLVSSAWQLLPTLYGSTVTDLGQVTDAYTLRTSGSPPDPCGFDWIVDSTNDSSLPASAMARVQQCGTFRRVFSSTSQLRNLAPSLSYVHYDSDTIVYQRQGTP